jgi:hypothetical protein
VTASPPRLSASKVSATVLSVAIEVAFQVSGFGGRWAQLVAWAAVICSGSVLVVSLIVARRHAAPDGQELLLELGALGRELGSFARGRRVLAPRPIRKLRPPRWATGHLRNDTSSAARSFSEDTMSLYDELYANRVNRAVAGLRERGTIGIGEAQALVTPVGVAAIESVARRLTELGRHLEVNASDIARLQKRVWLASRKQGDESHEIPRRARTRTKTGD